MSYYDLPILKKVCQNISKKNMNLYGIVEFLAKIRFVSRYYIHVIYVAW